MTMNQTLKKHLKYLKAVIDISHLYLFLFKCVGVR